ncbi:hypothetical protein [Roseateles asaccharophilus]|uniref:Uncharacterized protein n=1 Tax=Roseateles asaccharophilus TaxID=582607 RepID=A0ABU2A3G6_9BURK|nr:hypothetical protein [Roseateles asaccharophilus]MDR7331736.1 hypothetical protein [Roseateles asaccharophilus]
MNAAQLAGLDLPRPMRAPLAWLQADTLPSAFRACYLCTHGADEGIERVCRHPELLDRGAPQPVAVLRSAGGGCGPNAERLCLER